MDDTMAGPAGGIALDGARDAGFAPDALRRALGLLEGWVAEGVIPAAGALIARGGRVAAEAYVGLADPAAGRPADAGTIWALASITKPVTATAVMLLVERGLLALDQPVGTLLPEFLDGPAGSFDRRAVTLRQLLCHCSGLPGFPPENLAFRRAHRPLADFVLAALRQPVLFTPGNFHLYSNVALTLAAEIVGRALTGTLGRPAETPAMAAYHAFVREAILGPLGMADSALGPPAAPDGRIARVADTGQEGTDWEMANSAYYRGLGIPWGGLFSTPRDLIRFVDLFLPAAGGSRRVGLAPGEPATRLVAPATAQAMTTIQYAPPDAPPELAPDLRDGPPPAVPAARVEWGLGWEIKATKRAHEFGDLTSPVAFGHGGSTGTLAWADPATDIACVLLTNRARASGWHTEGLRLARFANAVVAAAL